MPAYEHAQMKGGGGDDKSPKKKKEWKGTARQPRKISDTKSTRLDIRSGRTSARKPRTWLHNPTPSAGAIAGAKKAVGSEVKRGKRVLRHLFMD